MVVFISNGKKNYMKQIISCGATDFFSSTQLEHNSMCCVQSRNIIYVCIAESEREGTRAKTRIGLSAKRTSPFKSAG